MADFVDREIALEVYGRSYPDFGATGRYFHWTGNLVLRSRGVGWTLIYKPDGCGWLTLRIFLI